MTAGPDLSGARAHDVGGHPAGPIDRAEHETEAWQNLVTALMYLLRDHCHLAKTDELRRTIEDMNPEDYQSLGYFDRWAVGFAALLVEKGVISPDEIEQRVGEISSRVRMKSLRRPNDVGGLPAGPVRSSGHEPEPWERLLSAVVSAVGPSASRIINIDEFRRAREDLEPDFYNSLTYFELWTHGFIRLMEEKGLLTRTEVDTRVADIKDRMKRSP